MKEFGNVTTGRVILVEKEDLLHCPECKLRGKRADYFVVPKEIKNYDGAMEQLNTCTSFNTNSGSIKFAEILYYE